MPNSSANHYWLAGLCALISFGSITLALHERNELIVAQGGSLVSAMAAIFVLIQFLSELEVRKAQAQLLQRRERDGPVLSPISQLAQRIVGNREKLAQSVVEQRLLQVVSSAAGCAALGELQDGFASQIYSTFASVLH